MITALKRAVIGCPLDTKSETHERLGVGLGLAMFASDALSSSAYATDEILFALVGMLTLRPESNGLTVGSLDLSNLFLCFPVAIAIAALLSIVVLSYRQIIKAYPDGGGAYVVAKENLGPFSSLLAAASLLLDYVLTVAVSVCAGVAAIAAAFHGTSANQLLLEERACTCAAIMVISVLTYINLRGIKESSRAMAIPAFLFTFCILSVIAIGLVRALIFRNEPAISYSGGAQIGVEHLAFGLLFLKAFAHGCAALTGIEAISNGVKAFREPCYRTANKTMVWMGCLLATIFMGLTYLALVYKVVPVEGDTVVSQITRAVLSGQDMFYYVVQASTMIILLLAANTSFGGFPRLAMILAADSYLPRQLMNVGDRLVYSNGILLLGFLSAFLVLLFHANVHALMPMYAIGVFLSFTLAQAGMVARHLKGGEDADRRAFVINAIGAFVTGIVCLLLCVEKFFAGAWLLLIALPCLIYVIRKIHAHYAAMQKQLAIAKETYRPSSFDHTVVVLVGAVNKPVLHALEYAKSISSRVEAVHVNLNPSASEELKESWAQWNSGVPLVVLDSPFRSLSAPLLKYIDEVEDRYDHDVVTIVVPEFVTRSWWQNLLHNQTALAIKAMLMFRPGKVVTTVRYHLKD